MAPSWSQRSLPYPEPNDPATERAMGLSRGRSSEWVMAISD